MLIARKQNIVSLKILIKFIGNSLESFLSHLQPGSFYQELSETFPDFSRFCGKPVTRCLGNL